MTATPVLVHLAHPRAGVSLARRVMGVPGSSEFQFVAGGYVEPGEIVASILATGQVKAESLIALQHALAVAQLDGVGGTLVLKLPRKPGAPIDAMFTTGTMNLRVEP